MLSGWSVVVTPFATGVTTYALRRPDGQCLVEASTYPAGGAALFERELVQNREEILGADELRARGNLFRRIADDLDARRKAGEATP